MNNLEAVYLSNDKKFVFREIPEVTLADPYQVKIRVKWVGICGSDLSSLETTYLSELRLGHEWVGQVVELGDGAKDFSIGDFVTSPVQIMCGTCENCRTESGDCAKAYSLAVSHGMLKKEAALPSFALVKLPPLSQAASTLFEILAVGENVYDQLKTKIQSEVLVLGAGLLGLSVALVLKRNQVPVRILEQIPSRIKRAQSLGLTCLHSAKALIDPTLNDRFPLVIDATGDHLESSGGWKYLEHFGKKKFVGVVLAKYLKPVALRTDIFFSKNGTLLWIQGCTKKSLEAAVENWSAEIETLSRTLITHTFKFTDTNEAFEMAKRRDQCSRVIIEVNS